MRKVNYIRVISVRQRFLVVLNDHLARDVGQWLDKRQVLHEQFVQKYYILVSIAGIYLTCFGVTIDRNIYVTLTYFLILHYLTLITSNVN